MNKKFEIKNVSYQEAIYLNKEERFDFIVSINDPDTNNFIDNASLKLEFHDIATPLKNYKMPSNKDMEQLFKYFEGILENKTEGKFLIHCQGGVSRSAAATFLLLMLMNRGNPNKSFNDLLDINFQATPNEFMLKWIEDKFKLSPDFLNNKFQEHFNNNLMIGGGNIF